MTAPVGPPPGTPIPSYRMGRRGCFGCGVSLLLFLIIAAVVVLYVLAHYHRT
jgi:hypothetical protein